MSSKVTKEELIAKAQKPAEDAMFQVPLAFIHNMQLVGHQLKTLRGPKRPFHLEEKEPEACPICESDLCRCCPDCKDPDCHCDQLSEDRIKMISEFVSEDLIQ